jgi:hypothetical protein
LPQIAPQETDSGERALWQDRHACQPTTRVSVAFK